ncbi:MAG: aminotransferase class V-fold PLP-dependent enzyme [Desulfobacterales bacterium]|nr:aminotransferase class V-fold PLP-dependent enzyme [Desulfobacterales bacterium]
MINEFVKRNISKLPPQIVTIIEKNMKRIPFINNRINKEIDSVMEGLEESMKPYRKTHETFSTLPLEGRSREDILREMEELNKKEESKWKEGYVSGAVYHGDKEHINFLNKVYAISSQSNPLHSDLWPSASKYEAEIISMTSDMLGARYSESDICGCVTSGGTESILLAMKTYRDYAEDKKGIKKPEMIVPVTAHAAFDKASEYFKIKMRHIPVDSNYMADVEAVKNAITRNTIVIVGSAPTFPHGTIDPIDDLSELARENNIGFHTDACLGGFVLPWAKKLGYDIPNFDFWLKGVTSISADTHKYGYAAKGTSVVMYRNEELRHYQYFTASDWPGGLYFSPTFAGSRAGALSASCWASLLSIGEKGYIYATKKIMDSAKIIKNGIQDISELYILGKPLWVIAFGSDEIDIYRVMDFMTKKGWSLNGLHKPSCIHIAVTLRHTQEGVAQRFIKDLKEAVVDVKNKPASQDGMAPIYGMAATLPTRGVVSDILKKYLDSYYRV